MDILDYKPMQTIKHALQKSIEYKRGTKLEADIAYEEMLLAEITDRLEILKAKYGIKNK